MGPCDITLRHLVEYHKEQDQECVVLVINKLLHLNCLQDVYLRRMHVYTNE